MRQQACVSLPIRFFFDSIAFDLLLVRIRAVISYRNVIQGVGNIIAEIYFA
jgi:hypothetical protein